MPIEMSGRYFLLKFRKNWADEFDCEGFSVVTGTHYADLETLFTNPEIRELEFEYNFGTNEGWEMTFGELWDDLEKIDITSSILWAGFLNQFFFTEHTKSFGIFPEFEYLFENVDLDDYPLIKQYYDVYENGDYKLDVREVWPGKEKLK